MEDTSRERSKTKITLGRNGAEFADKKLANSNERQRRVKPADFNKGEIQIYKSEGYARIQGEVES